MNIPALPASATQTQIAKAYMTPETAKALPDRVLDARIGQGTVAGGLNDAIRFRVRGSGTTRQIVPDNQLAFDLMKTTAGPKLIQQLEVASRSADWSKKSNLTGFVFPKDSQAVAAAEILSVLEPGGPPLMQEKEPTPRTPETMKKMMHEYAVESEHASRSAGAWNVRGWITFMPDTARMMLTQAGAYHPNTRPAADARLRRAAKMADYIAGVTTHEVQHSITSRKGRYEDVRWMEEGIANIFSKTPTFLSDIKHDTGINAQSYAAHIGAKPVIDLGWGAWTRKPLPPAERKKTDEQQKQRYADSQPILRGLLRMAGAGLNSNAGKDKARALLQGSELNRVPGNLARAIIERNGIDFDANYEQLRVAIRESIKDPHSLEKIAARFGVQGP
jgi:hypothetical protein